MSVVRKRILNTIKEDNEPEDNSNKTVSAEKTLSAGKSIFSVFLIFSYVLVKNPNRWRGIIKTANFAFFSGISVIIPRALTLFLRLSLIRIVGFQVVNIFFVRLELLATSILYFSRGGIRKASRSVAEASWRHSVNLTWLVIPFG